MCSSTNLGVPPVVADMFLFLPSVPVSNIILIVLNMPIYLSKNGQKPSYALCSVFFWVVGNENGYPTTQVDETVIIDL